MLAAIDTLKHDIETHLHAGELEQANAKTIELVAQSVAAQRHIQNLRKLP